MNYPVLVWWLALAVCVPSVVLSTATSPELNWKDYGKTWMFMPDGDGSPRVAYLVEPPESEDTRDKPTVIQMELYSRNNPTNAIKGKYLIMDNEVFPSLIESEQMIDEFNPDLDTKILVHGWRSSTMSKSIQSIRSAYIDHGDFNIFAIDWQDQADNIYYLNSARYTEQVGHAVAYLIDSLVRKKDADSKRIHLIGHSLGAHVMGVAGSSATNKVARITGLDPARLAFEDGIGGIKPAVHLDATDADFVDVIHTCAGFLGYQEPIGHADFYPNGGRAPQPGCNKIWEIFSGWSHERSYEYYAESINSKRGFYSVPCPTTEDAFEGKCSGSQILMGDPVPMKARGAYYLTTNEIAPFAQGSR